MLFCHYVIDREKKVFITCHLAPLIWEPGKNERFSCKKGKGKLT
jgi:hypothetical protein